MTTHVFIVDTNTFKYHLEFLFAGTGAKENFIDFNNNPTTSLNHTTENNLVSMIADAQRIRKGDFIIFYLQQNYSKKIWEGKFFRIFKAKDDYSFLDNNDSKQFLKKQLKKSLTFRILIEPFEIYPKGITEWEALDEIKSIQSPYQMLWSLIYRKLKGNRGNTMITLYESERLFKLLRDKNNRRTLNENCFSFNINNQEIIKNTRSQKYNGRKVQIDILPRLIEKCKNNRAFEPHLQAYIIQNIGRDTNKSLDECILDGLTPEWLGNEVACGVGMQKIDIMISLVGRNRRIIAPIELKSTEASLNSIIQIQRYIDWVEQYYIPNRISDIQPILVAKKMFNKNSNNYKALIGSLINFNLKNTNCYPIKFIEYEILKDLIIFETVTY